jgi:Domain of unknown function (DUF4249)
MHIRFRFFPWLVGGLSLTLALACTLDKSIPIDLPPYQNQLYVECYLEPGRPYQLALQESVGFFSAPNLPVVSGAQVVITYRNERIVLQNRVVVDSAQRRAYNYVANRNVPFDYTNEFTLQITDQQGRQLTGRTRLLRPVRFSVLTWAYRERDSAAYLLARFPDNPNETNYYRYITHKGRFLPNNREQDLEIADRTFNGESMLLASGYNYKRGDTLIASLYHIEKPYFDFLESTEDAYFANISPFNQPSAIRSNVQGGIGIFTGLSYDRRVIFIR